MSLAMITFYYVMFSIGFTEYIAYQSKNLLDKEWDAKMKIITFLFWPLILIAVILCVLFEDTDK